MRVLIVKTSSMGDVVHALPVVHDIRQAMPDAHIEWLVESTYAAIPRMRSVNDRLHGVLAFLAVLFPYALLKIATGNPKWSTAQVKLLRALQEGEVSFQWKDYRDGEQKVLTVAAEEFIRRFLLHILPHGFHRIFHGHSENNSLG
jgi:hypothetical protein